MFYLFIFESIGTSELMLIGLVALIVFGPRKLPELAKTIGKTMAEFRRSTDDFKKTWQQEIDLEGSKTSSESLTDLQATKTIKNENSISQNLTTGENLDKMPDLPKIREIDKSDFESNFAEGEIPETEQPKIVKSAADKVDWL